MRNKLLQLLCLSSLLFINSKVYSQIDLDDSKVLKIGYRLGYTSFGPAFYSTPKNSSTPVSQYKDHIFPSNLDIWYGKNSEHVFYDANIGGLVYAFGIYTYDLATGHEPTWINEKMKKSQSNFPSLTLPTRGSDFDVFDMKMGFGGSGIFVGGQVGYTYFGANSNMPSYDKDSNYVHSAVNSYYSYGLGVHYNKDMDNFIMQNSVTFDFFKNKSLLDGTGLKLESVISLGKDNGFYFAPYLKFRTLHTATTGGTGTAASAEKIKSSSVAFGIRAGFYLSE